MQLYAFLSQRFGLRRYAWKFFLIAFVGVHIPLVGLIVWLVWRRPDTLQALSVVVVALLCTLAATALTLWLLNALTRPIVQTRDALVAYLRHGTLPTLPTHHPDEVGELMRDTQTTLLQLDALLADKKLLITTLSHDLRSPAASVLGLIELCRADPASHAQYYDLMTKTLERQLTCMETVLAQLHQELPPVDQLSHVDLPTVLALLTDQIQAEFTHKKLRIVCQMPDTLPRVALADSELARILQNLLVNAAKFSHEGQTITVEATAHAEQLMLYVRDEGIGFAPEVAERLFDRFTDQRRTGTAGEPSHGVGLFLIRELVARAGGQLGAHSPGPGQGAIFTLQLPVIT